MKFGDKLKEIRKKEGDSFRSLAVKLDMPHTYIQKIESYGNPASQKVIDALIRIYPQHKKEIVTYYLQDYLSDSIKEVIHFNNEANLFIDIIDLLSSLEKEKQKVIYNLILEAAELTYIKTKNYESIKGTLENIKQKIEDL